MVPLLEMASGMLQDRSDSSRITRFLTAFFEAEMRAWRGDERLVKVFWGYGVAASSVLILFHVVAVHQGRIALQQALLLGFALYTGWILVSVWRCARNAAPLWAAAARWLTVAWAGNTIMVVVFLQLDLVKSYLGS